MCLHFADYFCDIPVVSSTSSDTSEYEFGHSDDTTGEDVRNTTFVSILIYLIILSRMLILYYLKILKN